MKNRTQQLGFTLVEMAIVTIILGILLAMLLLPLQAQRDASYQLQTETILENAQQSLVGFAQTHGRLPCPATNGAAAYPDGTGTENPTGGGVCIAQSGFLPAKSLGLQPADGQGYAVDAWGNRIRYAISINNTYAFTTNASMNNLGLSTLAPNLRVCASSIAASCSNTINLTDNAVAVIFSLGRTGQQASGGADETQNLTAPLNTTFVSHTITTVDAANGEFDHMVMWLSPFILYNAMISAGQLH